MEQTNKLDIKSFIEKGHRLICESSRTYHERWEKQARLKEMCRQENANPEEIAALEAEIEKMKAKEKELSAEMNRLSEEYHKPRR